MFSSSISDDDLKILDNNSAIIQIDAENLRSFQQHEDTVTRELGKLNKIYIDYWSGDDEYESSFTARIIYEDIDDLSGCRYDLHVNYREPEDIGGTPLSEYIDSRELEP